MDSLFYRGCSRREGLAEEHWRGEGLAEATGEREGLAEEH